MDAIGRIVNRLRMNNQVRDAQRKFKILTCREGPVRVWFHDGTSVAGEVPRDPSGKAVNAGELMTVVFADRDAFVRRPIKIEDIARLEMLPRRFFGREPKSPPWVHKETIEAKHPPLDMLNLQRQVEARVVGYVAPDLAYFVEQSETMYQNNEESDEPPMIRIYITEREDGPLLKGR